MGEHHGTVAGVALSKDRFGRKKQAYAFAGSSDDPQFITVPTPFGAGDADFTIATWLMPSEVRLAVVDLHDTDNVMTDATPPHTMRLDLSGPLSRKRLAFSSQAL